MKPKHITTPCTPGALKELHAGDEVLITGTLYVARDAAHKRLEELVKQHKPLPFDIKNQILFYAGPAPAKPGQPIGAIGPTTSYRMDPYTKTMLQQGLVGAIGKGERDPEVMAAFKKHSAVYFVAIGGIAALLAKQVISSKIIAYPELGAEAVRELEVSDFPVIVAQDATGVTILKS